MSVSSQTRRNMELIRQAAARAPADADSRLGQAPEFTERPTIKKYERKRAAGDATRAAPRPPPGPSEDRLALSVKQFCAAYGICRQTFYDEIKRGRLKAVKLGAKTMVLKADADSWAASLPELRTVGREQA
jgi:predicted DNA-binding transcriptional regulator AlpA